MNDEIDRRRRIGINPKVWADGENWGLLDFPLIEIKLQPTAPRVQIKQCPISLDRRKGLSPIIKKLIQGGILEKCKSPYNTSVLAVQKPDGTYHLVQDLKEINKRTITRFPVVPNSYTLLGRIPPGHRWFSVIDLKDAFWACPLAEGSHNFFAFEWKEPGSGVKLRWTRLPQGFTESPNLFGQPLEELLSQYALRRGTNII